MNNTKLLILSDWYLPGVKAGGPIRSVDGIVQALNPNIDIWLITSDRDLNDSEPYSGIETDQWLKRDDIHLYYASPKNVDGIIKSELQKVWNSIYLNSLFSFRFTVRPLLICNSLKINKVVLAPRGMLGNGALQIKRNKKQIFLNLAKLFGLYNSVIWHVSSKFEKEQVLTYFKNADARVLTSLSKMKSSDEYFQNMPDEMLRMVVVARIAQVKNLDFLLSVLKSVSCKYYLHIYGPIEDALYWDECNVLIESISTIKINYLGEITHDEVRTTLEEYHCLFLPTEHENFGHVFIEAWSSGCMTLISDQTPWKNLEDKKVGYEIALQNKDLFILKVNDLLLLNQESLNDRAMQCVDFSQEIIENEAHLAANLNLFEND